MSLVEILVLVTFVAASRASKSASALEDQDSTTLLQVTAQRNSRSASGGQQVPQEPSRMPLVGFQNSGQLQLPSQSISALSQLANLRPGEQPGMKNWNGVCDVQLKEDQDCEPFSAADMYRKLSEFTWQSRLCKIRIPPLQFPHPDQCLWQGCVAQKQLEQGARWYMQYKSNEGDIPYCFKEHCGNTEFTLTGTTLEDSNRYCTKKFGGNWTELLAGPQGLGWPGEEPGSGLWECAHGNYHCDWAYCKMYFCDNPEIRAQWCSGNNCPPLSSTRTIAK